MSHGFEWDENKNRENLEKHGVAFGDAQYAFADPQRVIAKDLTHSQEEERYYCFGKVGAASSPFDLPIEGALFVLSALGIGGKENRPMKKKITYTDEPLGDIQVVDDFLPLPEQFIFKGDEAKVTDDKCVERESVERRIRRKNAMRPVKSGQTSKRFVKSSTVLKAMLGRYFSSSRRARK